MKIVLQQKQMLKMVMTTELRQAIELLQLSTYELLQFIQEEVEENPFIELIERDDDQFNDRPSRKVTSEQVIDPIEFATRDEKSMHEHLLEQLMWLYLDDKEYKLISYLILNINEQGYLTVKDEEVYEQFHLSKEELTKAKHILHQLEPKGIGASSLAECLAIQAKAKYPQDDLLLTVIEDYLQLIGDKQWKKVAEGLNIQLAQVKELYELIQTLNPKPATGLSSVKIDYVNPDIFIDVAKENGTYTIRLNDYYIPKLTFNDQYSNNLPKTEDLSQYVNHHYKKFDWLQKSIEQRRATILKIMGVIVKEQHQFLRRGLRFLKPLTLKDVADEIEMHESTVSRATANKIVQTPVGTFELRALFSTKLATQTGSDASQTEVKEMLREIIENEDKYKPLSDQKIADELKKDKGIIISRRTVAKYRDELNIPPSSKRKEIRV